jgi:hypothetical protein
MMGATSYRIDRTAPLRVTALSSPHSRTSSMGEAAAEISKAGRVGVEEDSMDLAVGNGQGDSGEGIPVSIEDQRGLPVELSLFDFELGATGRRGHEGGHVRRALERPPEVADAPESAALWSAVRDQDGVRGE